jgi:DNA topoisomerase-6 subunit B
MASVWVPFTSESKEAVADYDEIRKEIRLALNEAGRRLSSFVRKRDRAALEMKRRDVFEAYIEEVADACKRLKKGKLDAEDLKKRLAKIAKDVTGGDKTDEILKKKDAREEQPAGEATIIVTPEGVQGAVPVAPPAEAAPAAAEAVPAKGEKKGKPAAPAKGKEKTRGKGKR